MNDPLWTPERLALAHDQAHAEVQRLRLQALDDFWRTTDALLAEPSRRALRTAEPLRHRLMRHRRWREQP